MGGGSIVRSARIDQGRSTTRNGLEDTLNAHVNETARDLRDELDAIEMSIQNMIWSSNRCPNGEAGSDNRNELIHYSALLSQQLASMQTQVSNVITRLTVDYGDGCSESEDRDVRNDFFL